MKKIVSIFVVCLFITALSTAQKTKTISGDFKYLSGQKNINVVFNYDDLQLMKENFSEEKYISQRKADLNEKTRGNGDLWEQKWNAAKEGIWEPKFLELMLKTVTEKENVIFQKGLDDAKYTLIVDVVWIYPGWDAAVMKQKAKVTTLLKFVETANPDKILLEISSKDAPGDQWGSNFSNESRIGEGFAKTGKTLGKILLKKAY